MVGEDSFGTILHTPFENPELGDRRLISWIGRASEPGSDSTTVALQKSARQDCCNNTIDTVCIASKNDLYAEDGPI